MTTLYKYLGHGGAIPGVPARDLTDEDVAERKEEWERLEIDEAALLRSGLYEKVKAEPKQTKAAKEK